MKIKPFFVVITLVCSCNLLLAQNSDFRNLSWGMTSSEVKSQESNRMLSEESSRIFYDCMIGEIPGRILYTFTTTDQLMRAKYYLDPNYINLSFYVKDYKMFQELLSQKYGEPFKKREITVNKSTISEAEWPVHLASGNLRLETQWNTDRSEISLTTSKVGDNIIIQIDYVSKEMTKIDLVERKQLLLQSL